MWFHWDISDMLMAAGRLPCCLTAFQPSDCFNIANLFLHKTISSCDDCVPSHSSLITLLPSHCLRPFCLVCNRREERREEWAPPEWPFPFFIPKLISKLGCLNCLLEGWREIEQYPLALATSPTALHWFLCRVRTDLGTAPLWKRSPGRPDRGRSGEIN